jgi:tetratricopeptide (TPR) repeat protein
LGQVEQAMEHYEQALTIAREIGDRYFEGTWLYYLGDLYKNQANLPLARRYLEQAQAIYEEIKSPYANSARKLLAELEGDSSSSAV